MREFVRKCEDAFDAIVKLTMVKYIFPKLKNRWGIEELTKQAARRPKKYYRTSIPVPCAARSLSRSWRNRGPPSSGCLMTLSRSLIQVHGSSASSSRSPTSLSLPTCFASPHWAQTSSGHTIGARGSTNGIRGLPLVRHFGLQYRGRTKAAADMRKLD